MSHNNNCVEASASASRALSCVCHRPSSLRLEPHLVIFRRCPPRPSRSPGFTAIRLTGNLDHLDNSTTILETLCDFLDSTSSGNRWTGNSTGCMPATTLPAEKIHFQRLPIW
ncbi:hypothetical protein MPTK1_5g06980 [Marchantia polymorpha subsp. ruderalis]|uniref:Uncharacterized protein n=2 Tax=Marchantia polymorpha TaxID=3197 RepID=A0AAF6BFS1_MARPO|nr:hypothetical protein MARPO_0136s0024 [Marchantia polymorpha]BBN10855.1 hypothetical protein Mp_5g06980 [Marchantia polymorpha subsp. ruderalis]|eukprot:PTQ29696.1 hypothetical protein MARPO_0136s0024 [Marchantia polymorpha]